MASGTSGALDRSDRVSNPPREDTGPEANQHLTTTTGAVLIVMLAVLGVTILRIRPLIWLHLFLGLALLGPVALKLVSAEMPRTLRPGPGGTAAGAGRWIVLGGALVGGLVLALVLAGRFGVWTAHPALWHH